MKWQVPPWKYYFPLTSRVHCYCEEVGNQSNCCDLQTMFYPLEHFGIAPWSLSLLSCAVCLSRSTQLANYDTSAVKSSFSLLMWDPRLFFPSLSPLLSVPVAGTLHTATPRSQHPAHFPLTLRLSTRFGISRGVPLIFQVTLLLLGIVPCANSPTCHLLILTFLISMFMVLTWHLELCTVWCVWGAWRGWRPPCPSPLAHPRCMSRCFCPGHRSVPRTSLPLSMMVTVPGLWVAVGDGNSRASSGSRAPTVKHAAHYGWAPVGPGPCWQDQGPTGSGRDPLATMLGSKGLIQRALCPPVCLFLPERLLLPCICVPYLWWFM